MELLSPPIQAALDRNPRDTEAGTPNPSSGAVSVNSEPLGWDGLDLVMIHYLKARHTELYTKLRNAVSHLKRKG
jgi:hypothetical protein